RNTARASGRRNGRSWILEASSFTSSESKHGVTTIWKDCGGRRRRWQFRTSRRQAEKSFQSEWAETRLERRLRVTLAAGEAHWLWQASDCPGSARIRRRSVSSNSRSALLQFLPRSSSPERAAPEKITLRA